MADQIWSFSIKNEENPIKILHFDRINFYTHGHFEFYNENMSVYICFYNSPLGRMFLTCDSDGITSVGFENQRFSYSDTGDEYEESDTPSFKEGRRWLDIYFSGKEAGFTPPLHLIGTAFQKEVWEILLKIPYGSVMTYGKIAKEIAEKRGLYKMSSRAVGGAVGHNPISIIVPCHRVIGSDGNITGYGGGIERKIKLLTLEGYDTSTLKVPGKLPSFCSIPAL